MLDIGNRLLSIGSGGIVGAIGVQVGKILSAQKRGLTLVFGSLVILVGIYVVARGVLPTAQAGE